MHLCKREETGNEGQVNTARKMFSSTRLEVPRVDAFEIQSS